MKFGPTPLDEAEGALLAHSLRLPDGVLFRKGRRLSTEDVRALRVAGFHAPVTVRLGPDDVPEDEAARTLAAVLAGEHVTVAAPLTGRCNVVAARDGLAIVDAAAVHAVNRVHEGVTVATLASFAVVRAGDLVATVKIIPFAVPADALEACLATVPRGKRVVSVAPFQALHAGIVLTRLEGTPVRALEIAAERTVARLRALGGAEPEVRRCAHDEEEVARAIDDLLRSGCSPVLILGASAVVDREDVVPAAVVRVGGRIDRFGMPVDPGNLLVLAHVEHTPVVGLPGCARSPKESGFDRVLERLMAGLAVTPDDVVEMGVGGLLKEVPRPAPRRPGTERRSGIAAVVLAAGSSKRAGPVNKLLARVEGEAIVRRVARAATESGVSRVVVVTGHEAERIRSALEGLDVAYVHNRRYDEGMSTSVRAGLAAAGPVAGAVICLGDMPWVRADHIDALLDAFDPDEGRAVCVPVHERRRGNPVLWAAAFFPEMERLEGDQGARKLLEEHADEVWEVPVDDPGVLRDVDTLDAVRELEVVAPEDAGMSRDAPRS